MNNSAHYQYKKSQVEGVDQGTMIIMLYEGALKFLRIAEDAIGQNDIESAHNHIIRAQAIITELMNSLKVDVGDVAVNLLRLYEFMLNQLSVANAKKDKMIINGVVKLLSSLRDGWVNVVAKLKVEAREQAGSDSTEENEEFEKKPIDVAV